MPDTQDQIYEFFSYFQNLTLTRTSYYWHVRSNYESYLGIQCVCKSGFEGDGQKCEKKQNNCEKCDENAKCFTRGFPPTSTCKCNIGFTGDGFSCKAKNPCAS